MNHREPPHSPAARHKALRCLLLTLLPVLAPIGAHALPRSLHWMANAGRTAETVPYLPATGAPPLRFQEATTSADLAARSPGTAPSTAATTPGETSVTPTSIATAGSVAATTASGTPATSTAVKPSNSDPAHPVTKAPAPILPDETRPTVRPEDFLPYFQIPGSARHPEDVTLLVPVPKAAPAPGTLPPSSATYTQTPK